MKVALIMGSISDEEIVKKSAAVLKDFPWNMTAV